MSIKIYTVSYQNLQWNVKKCLLSKFAAGPLLLTANRSSNVDDTIHLILLTSDLLPGTLDRKESGRVEIRQLKGLTF
jgi:hypothetical protein